MVKNAAEEMKTLVDTWKVSTPGVQIIVTIEENRMFLHLLYIPLSLRRKGYGSEIMVELNLFADRNNMTVMLEAESVYNIPTGILISFYEKHGFRVLDERNNLMMREPLYSAEFSGG